MAEAIELALMAAIYGDVQELSAVPWSLLVQETASDPCFGYLLRSIEQGSKVDMSDPALENLQRTCRMACCYKRIMW